MARLVTALALALLAVLTLAAGASAHEHRTVGSYTLVVGFLDEPPVVDEPNGVSLTVTKGQGADATPVEGLAEMLKVDVVSHGQTMPLAFEPVFGTPGAYRADFIPTASGTYAFHITGTIDGQPVDERFTSGPNTFDDVNARAALSFPVKTDSAAALQQTAHDAQQAADTARLLGIGGLVVGVLGLIAGGAGLRAARQARATAATETEDVAVKP
ncbi:MAG TPA: hypothetical protein VFI42_02620 [Thermomicrobiaceae bacterium]|nr:hypothetical protein [Thermomicrobiaceae bacterium]